MKRGIWGFILLAALLAWTLPGCTYTHQKNAQDDIGTLGDVHNCGPVDFATVNAKVFARSCVGCHKVANADKVKGVILDSYPNIVSHAQDSLEQVLSDAMPQGPALGKEQKELLAAWVEQGMPQFTGRPSVQSCADGKDKPPVVTTPPPPPTDTTPEVLEANYNSIKKFIMDVKCTGCHGINDHKPKPNKFKFDTYEHLISNTVLFTPLDENSKFASALIDGDMPAVGDSLTDEEIDVVVEWIKAGLPETKGGVPALLPDIMMNLNK